MDDNKSKYAGGLKNQIADVIDRIEGAFPDFLDLKEQGLFALGYYQQQAWRKENAGKSGATEPNKTDQAEPTESSQFADKE